MYSVGEIFNSREFKKEIPEGIDFLIHRFLRENERIETEKCRNKPKKHK